MATKKQGLGKGLGALLGDAALQPQSEGALSLPISQVQPGLNQPRKRFEPEALAELRLNAHTYAMLCELVHKNWKHHDTLMGFAMDHGCHEIDGGCGSHGLDMSEDVNITHFYKAYAAEEAK